MSDFASAVAAAKFVKDSEQIREEYADLFSLIHA
jgi:hypothetical protein